MAEKNIRQAFGCAQHPKAGRNTQQITLTCTLLTLMNVNFFEQTLSFIFLRIGHVHFESNTVSGI